MSHLDAARVMTERAGIAPRVGIVLGSGLGAVAEAVSTPTVVAYDDLPGFPRATVAGQHARAVLGRIGAVPVAVLQGRAHVYEGGDLDDIRIPVRALRSAGAEILVLTNAAGSLRAEVGPGQLMLITDHINLSGVNILAGPNDDSIGPRFPSLRDAYDPELRERLQGAATELGTELAEGVYLAMSGPTFETPAEIRAIERLGADAVGMSTVHETAVARHAGLRVAAIAAITNLAEGMTDEAVSHDQALKDAHRAADALAPLLVRFVEGLGD